MKKISIRPEREYLREIVSKMQDGQYAVPAFQRDLVWSTTQIIELFDSITKGYPIGSIICGNLDLRTPIQSRRFLMK